MNARIESKPGPVKNRTTVERKSDREVVVTRTINGPARIVFEAFTKAELLKAAVDYAIAGDVEPIPMLARESVAAMEATPDAGAMLGLHTRHARAVNGRAAQLFWVVEQAAPAHQDIAALWAQMSGNRRAAAHWAAAVLLAKPGLPPHVTQAYAEEVFWLAIDPGTYRSLTLGRGLSPAGFETWIGNYYDKMLLT